MPVPKRKRKQSDFEVFNHFYRMRAQITDLLLRDFGYNAERAAQSLNRYFKPAEERTVAEQIRYERKERKYRAFEDWFIYTERQFILETLRELNKEMFMANSIYPTSPEELAERRLCQDRAIGLCYVLKQELQYAMATLPVDVDKYTRFSDMLDHEAVLIRGWRKSDSKYKQGSL